MEFLSAQGDVSEAVEVSRLRPDKETDSFRKKKKTG